MARPLTPADTPGATGLEYFDSGQSLSATGSADGSPVTGWTAIRPGGGTPNVASVIRDDWRPVLSTVNGRRAVYFGTGVSRLQLGIDNMPVGTASKFWFFVSRIRETRSGDYYPAGYGSGQGTGVAWKMRQGAIPSSDIGNNGYEIGTVPIAATGLSILIEAYREADEMSRAWYNGQAVASQFQSRRRTTTDRGVGMGYWPEYGGGSEHDMLLYGYAYGDPTDDAFRDLEGCLSWTTNDNGASLAAGHRWKNEQPMVSGGPTLSAGSGAIILTGRTANLLLGHTLPAAGGVLTLSGQSVRTIAARRLPAATGGFAITGKPASLARTRVIKMGAASITLTGQPVNLLHGFSLSASGGAFSLAGIPARLRAARRLVADAGSFLMTGHAADLRRVGRLMIDAAGGQFTLTGQPAAIRATRRLVAEPGMLLLTGSAIVLTRANVFALDSGAFRVGGSAVALRSSRRLVASGGMLSLAARPVMLRLSRRLRAERGSFIVTVAAAAINVGRVEAPVFIPIADRFIVPARPRTFVIPARPRAFVIRKGARMSPIRKYRVEERSYQADWSPDLAGQTIVGEIVATSNDPALIVDRVTYDGPIMRFWLRGGTPGEVSTIIFTAPTSGREHLVWVQMVSCPL